MGMFKLSHTFWPSPLEIRFFVMDNMYLYEALLYRQSVKHWQQHVNTLQDLC